MARFDSRYAPINREKRDMREDLIHSKNNATPAIEKMFDVFVKGIATLEEAIAKGKPEKDLQDLRDELGTKGWSLQYMHGYDLKKFKLSKLGVKLSMGKVLSNKRG